MPLYNISTDDSLRACLGYKSAESKDVIDLEAPNAISHNEL